MTKVILPTLLIVSLLALLSFAPVSMPMMGEMDSQMAHHTSESLSVMPCCEMISSACALFVCNVSELTKIFFINGTSRIISVTTAIQLIFIDILSPPPKA